jgi:predicted  nucleic acid-binding Zn-ribbon protein
MSQESLANQKQDAKEVLLRKLATWATQRELLQDTYILSLIKDITEDRNLGFWADQDPMQLLPAVETTAGITFMKFAKIFALLRNVLVFLPVALTWKAVSAATTGFSQFVSVNNAAPVNFLEFWQNGYGYLDKFWTIGAIAQIDFLIILLVILITLVSNILQNNGQKVNEIMNDTLEKEKISIVLDIKKYLFMVKPSSVETINSDILLAIDKFNQGTREFNKISNNIESLSDYLIKAVPQVQAIQESMNKISMSNNEDLEKVLSSFTTQVNSGVSNLNSSLIELQKNIGSINSLITEALTNSVSSMSGDIDNSNRAVKRSAKQLESELENLSSQINITTANLKAKIED